MEAWGVCGAQAGPLTEVPLTNQPAPYKVQEWGHLGPSRLYQATRLTTEIRHTSPDEDFPANPENDRKK